MNILFIAFDYRPGGISEGVSAFELVSAMQALGHSVTVMTRDGCDRPEVIHVPVKRPPQFLMPTKIHYYEFLFKARRIAKTIAKDFDLIQHISPISLRYHDSISSLGAPFIWGAVGGSIPYPPGFESISRRDSAVIRFRGLDRFRLHWDPLLRSTQQNSRRIVLTSEAAQTQIPQAYREKCVVIPEGFRSIVSSEFDAGIPEEPFIFSSGRFVPYKALDLLVRAYLQCPSTVPRLVLSGDGLDRKLIEDIIREAGGESRVVLLGRVPKPMNLQLMARSKFCVFPALKEAFGHVNLEAMAAGKSLIVTDWGGPADIVVEGVTGYKVLGRSPSEHINLLAERITFLSEHDDICKSMGLAGRHRLLNQYSWSNIGEMYQSLYRETLS